MTGAAGGNRGNRGMKEVKRTRNGLLGNFALLLLGYCRTIMGLWLIYALIVANSDEHKQEQVVKITTRIGTRLESSLMSSVISP